MKCQMPFSREIKKNIKKITSLSSAEFAHSMVSVNRIDCTLKKGVYMYLLFFMHIFSDP